MVQVYIDNEEIETNISEIMLDDTISMIKQKIFHKTKIPIEDMYLYANVRIQLSSTMVYSLLSLNGKVGVLSSSLNSFINNITSPSGLVAEIKQKINKVEKDSPNNIYSFQEIKELIQEKIVTLKKPLGIVFNNRANINFMDNILLSADPYSVKEIPDRYVVYSNNEEVLLRYIGDIQMSEITIHVCTIKEVIKHYKYPTVIELINLYFPKFDKVPINLKEVETDVNKQSAIFNKTSQQLYTSNVKYFKTIEFWNNFLKEDITPPTKSGFTRIHFNYKGGDPSIKLPLEYIFKCIHASELFPLIRYVMSKRREPFVRLYAPNQSKYDTNVPILTKADLNRIFTTFGKSTGVQVFMSFFEGTINSFITLKENGMIEVLFETENNSPISKDPPEILKLINSTLNIFIDNINIILKQSDIFINPFKNLMIDTEFKSMDFVSMYPLNNSKNIMNTTRNSHMMNVFYNPNKEKKKTEKQKEKIKQKEKEELSFYFTRVSNFNIDSDPETNTIINVWYSVNLHTLYIKASNIKAFQYILTIPDYLNTFVTALIIPEIYNEMKEKSTTVYSYNTYKGEDIIIEKEEEPEEEEEEDEINEIDKLIMEQLLKPSEEEGRKISSKESETGSILGDLEDLGISSDLEKEEEEEEELGDLDEDDI